MLLCSLSGTSILASMNASFCQYTWLDYGTSLLNHRRIESPALAWFFSTDRTYCLCISFPHRPHPAIVYRVHTHYDMHAFPVPRRNSPRNFFQYHTAPHTFC
ncbi:hypothetical protein BDZ94DRAFT_1253866, partial [Collybia nuda]